MSNSIWDDPMIQVVEDYIKIDTVGQETGWHTIANIGKKEWSDGGNSIELTLINSDGEERQYSAGARNLKARLIELRPSVGDKINIKLLSETPLGGGRKVRAWDVQVQPGSAAAAPTGALAPAPAQDPQALAAALANLTPEQRQALGLS